MTVIEVLSTPQNIFVNTTNIEIFHRTQQIVVNPTDNSVTVVNAGPIGPKGATGASGIVTSNTPPTNTGILWVDTSVSGVVFETELRSDMVTPYSYVGVATINSSESSPVWKITRISTIAPVSTSVATNVAWSNRLSVTYF